MGRKCRFRLLLFLVSIWLRCDWRCLNLPEAVLVNRFAALLFVFNLGIALSLLICNSSLSFGCQHHHHLPSFQFWDLLHSAVRFQIFLDPVQHLAA